MMNNSIAKWVLGLHNHLTSPAEDLSAPCKLVLLTILSYANWNHHTCYPGIERLSRDTSYSPRRVRSAIQELCCMGYLELELKGCRGDGKGRGRLANVYRVHVPNEILPARYRTNRHHVPQSQAGLNGKNDGLSGTKVTDQPAPRAPQDINEVINKQETHSGDCGTTDATQDFEKQQLLNDAQQVGVRGSHVEAAISKDGQYNVAKAIGLISQWQKPLKHADALFGRALQTVTGRANQPDRLRLPHDDNQLWPFAQANGLSDAQPGEDYFSYRNRLNAEIKRKHNS